MNLDWINGVFFALYVGFVLYQLLGRKKSFGLVSTREDSSLVPFCVIELYNEQGVRVKFSVSDVLGRYYLLTKKGSYIMKVRGTTLSGRSFEGSKKVLLGEGILKEDIMV